MFNRDQIGGDLLRSKRDSRLTPCWDALWFLAVINAGKKLN